MVSTTVNENGSESVKVADNFPTGDLRVVGWDVDTTGRTLLDEICQLAAYTPSEAFSQYVMPHGDFKFVAKKKHKIKVVTVGRYRMLKNAITNKLVKTKSEISALQDFLQWLEQVRADTKGIILVTYESNELAAPLLLESLRRYNLLERFSGVVKGFANGYSVAAVKCAKTVCSLSLRTLSKVLLDNSKELDNAVDRARLSFQIVEHLLAEERPENKGSGDGGVGLAEALREYAVPISKEEENIEEMKALLNRKKSLRPVFESMMNQSKREVTRAIALRSITAGAGISYEDLVNAHKNNGEDGIQSLLNSKTDNIKPKDLEDLKNLITAHFNAAESGTDDGKSSKEKSDKSVSEELSNSNSPDTSSPIKQAANGSVSESASPDSGVSPQKSPDSPETVSNTSDTKSN